MGASSVEMENVARAVTRAVVDRLGNRSPQVIEAVVTEVLGALSDTTAHTTPRGAVLPVLDGKSLSPEYCSSCIEQERARNRQRAVMTTTGKNQKGIVARVTARIADLGGDILDISQTLVGDFFTMIIVIDVSSLSVPFAQFQDELKRAIAEMGCQTMMLHEDVMTSLHRV